MYTHHPVEVDSPTPNAILALNENNKPVAAHVPRTKKYSPRQLFLAIWATSTAILSLLAIIFTGTSTAPLIIIALVALPILMITLLVSTPQLTEDQLHTPEFVENFFRLTYGPDFDIVRSERKFNKKYPTQPDNTKETQ